jgi:hypothetical protein
MAQKSTPKWSISNFKFILDTTVILWYNAIAFIPHQGIKAERHSHSECPLESIIIVGRENI